MTVKNLMCTHLG